MCEVSVYIKHEVIVDASVVEEVLPIDAAPVEPNEPHDSSNVGVQVGSSVDVPKTASANVVPEMGSGAEVQANVHHATALPKSHGYKVKHVAAIYGSL